MLVIFYLLLFIEIIIIEINIASEHDFLKLKEVVQSKNILRLKKIISDRIIDLHSRGPSGQTILHVAAKVGNHAVLKILLEVISNSQPTDLMGKTPVHVAAVMGHRNALAMLLDNGAYIDSRDNWGRTPLHDAVEKHKKGIVHYLVGRGAKVDATDNIGNTPLHLASCYGTVDIVEVLLKTKSATMLRNKIGRTPLAISAFCGRHRLFTLLSSLPHPPHFKDRLGNTIEELAVMGKSPKLINHLLTSKKSGSKKYFDGSPFTGEWNLITESGEDNLTAESLELLATSFQHQQPQYQIPLNDDTSQSLYHMKDKQPTLIETISNPSTLSFNDSRFQDELFYKAIFFDDIESIEKILVSGYTFQNKRLFNQTPAEYAINHCRVRVLEIFLANGLNANETDKLNQSLIHIAISRGNLSVDNDKLRNTSFVSYFDCSLALVDVLLKFGADLEAHDGNGRTPLHLAVEFDNINVIKLLISSGADVEHRDASGKTPLFISVEGNKPEVFRLLVSLNASIHVSGTDRHYYPIHIAARDGRIDILTVLLEEGAYIEQKCFWYERRPLHEASVNNQSAAVEYLILRGADVDSADNWGRTSLHLAAEYGFVETGLVLIESNANLEAFMRESRTPLIVASITGQYYFSKLLLEKGANFRQRSQDGRTILHWACCSGNPQLVKKYVLEFPEFINDLDHARKSSLFWASFTGDFESCRLLIAKGANTLVRTDINMTILHAAAESGNYLTVKEILRYGIDVNGVDKNGRTALFMAAKSGHIDVVSLLLHHGADPLVRSKLNETLLHWAAFSGDLEVTKAVINITKNINPQDSEGITPLYRAAINGRYDVFEILLDNGGDPTIARNNGDTIMHWAAHYGEEKVMNRLLKKVNNLEYRDRKGRTPLYVSAEYGRSGTFDLLVSKGANLNITSSDGRALAHAATIGRNINILRFLLNTSSDINVKENMGRTPLFIAASIGSTVIFEYLLENGAELCAETYDGRTVLHAAAFGGDSRICNTILQKSNMINTRDENGMTPLYYAVEKRRRAAFYFLLRSGSDTKPAKRGWTLLHSAAKGGDVIIFNTVLNLTDNIDAREDKGQTPLFISASNSHAIIFQLLLSRNANPDIPNNIGYTILHWACHYGDYDFAINILNISESSVNAEDIGRKTPLHWAVYYGHTSLAELLLRHGADPEIENSYGYTPMMIAAARGTVKMMEAFSSINYNGEAMLGIALAWGNREVLNYFLLSRVKPTEKNILHFAAARGDNAELVKLFQVNANARRERFYDITKEITKEYSRFTMSMDADDVYIINPVQFKLSPLEMAILFNGSVETIQLILNMTNTSFLDLAKSGRRWTPLDMAAFCGKDSLVRYFIDIGVPVNDSSADSWTSVHKASWGGHTSTIKLLHQNGADINAVDSLGRTPLHIAAMRGFIDTVFQILNLSRRSVNAKDRYFFTPLHLSEIFGHQKYFDNLALGTITLDATLRYGIKDPGLVTSSLRNHTRTIEVLLDSGADPDSQDRVFGWTVLHWSAAIGHQEVVSLLLDRGASVNIPSKTQQTPMYLSRYWGRIEIYNLLRERNGVW